VEQPSDQRRLKQGLLKGSTEEQARKHERGFDATNLRKDVHH